MLIFHEFVITEASKAKTNENIAMYIGLCVAIAVFIIVIVVIVIVIRRRNSNQHNTSDRDHLPNGGKLRFNTVLKFCH